MESKNVKVIDEHNIDRDANVVSAFKVDNNDYVLYWIERDEENANLFVSKILKNNDGTYSMSNIEDSTEKGKIGDVVKGMVTLAIKNENDKASPKVSLEGGKEIDLSTVRFNKEQNINVTKTYVTTVKKAVAKVSNDFYNVPVTEEKKEEPLFNDIFVAPPVEEIKVEMPSIDGVNEEKKEEPTEEVVNNEEVMNSFVDNVGTEAPVAEPSNVVVPEAPKVEETPAVNNNVSAIPTFNTPVEEVKEAPVVEPTPVVQPQAPAEAVSVQPVPQPASVVIPVPLQPQPEVKLEGTPAPAPTEAPQSFFDAQPVQNGQPLVFDASQETNLNNALNNSNLENIVVTEDVNSLRSFGMDEGEAANIEATNATQDAAVKKLTKSKGFANSKIVAIIGVCLFVAACVFMGYEIFNYFNIVK